MQNNNELKEIKTQIDAISSVMNKSGSTFRLIYSAQNFWYFFLFSGALSVIIPLLFHIFITSFGTYQQIPYSTKIILFCAVAISWIILITVQLIISKRAAKKLEMNLSVFAIIKEMIITKIWVAVLPVIVCAVVIPVLYPFLQTPVQYISYSGIILGIVLNIIGVMANEKEYSFSGFWMMVAGLVLFALTPVSAQMAFLLIFAPSCFLFVLIALVTRHKKRKTNEPD